MWLLPPRKYPSKPFPLFPRILKTIENNNRVHVLASACNKSIQICRDSSHGRRTFYGCRGCYYAGPSYSILQDHNKRVQRKSGAIAKPAWSARMSSWERFSKADSNWSIWRIQVRRTFYIMSPRLFVIFCTSMSINAIMNGGKHRV